MKIHKAILFIVAVGLSWTLAGYFGKLYNTVFNTYTGFSSFIISSESGEFIDGVSFSYTFFVVLVFTALGGEKKYWWIGILLIPAVIFELYFDAAHIYFPIILGLIGWLIGLGISKLLARRSA